MLCIIGPVKMMKTETLAINICFTFKPTEIGELFQLNRKVFEISGAGYLFDGEHYPHLTLHQNFVYRAQLEEVFSTVDSAVNTLKWPRIIKNNGLNSEGSYVGDKRTLSLDVSDSQKCLWDWNQFLAKNLLKDGAAPGGVEAFYKGYGDEFSVNWAKNYQEKSLGGDFRPHITLGLGSLTDLEEGLASISQMPQVLPVRRLVVGVMGNMCSLSPEILKSWDFSQNHLELEVIERGSF